MLKITETLVPESLTRLALVGLPQMQCRADNFFCEALKLTPEGLQRTGVSRINTLIVLLGVAQASKAGWECAIDKRSILANIWSDFPRIRTGGEIGLYLWLAALERPDLIALLCRSASVRDGLFSYPDIRQLRTMQLAWLISGLSHAKIADPSLGELNNLADDAYDMLRGNQNKHGLFLHNHRTRSVSGLLRSHIGSFADQIYPIYALTKYAEAFGVKAALNEAIATAEAICQLQGPQGQWWWHYDVLTGRVIAEYPVYSVHQDGMAPFALFALEQATGRSYSTAVDKGLEWIIGKNEKHMDLRDFSRSVIWRNIHLNQTRRYMREALCAAHLYQRHPAPNSLEVLFECHSYHLGWILYAFAERLVTDASGDVPQKQHTNL